MPRLSTRLRNQKHEDLQTDDRSLCTKMYEKRIRGSQYGPETISEQCKMHAQKTGIFLVFEIRKYFVYYILGIVLYINWAKRLNKITYLDILSDHQKNTLDLDKKKLI